MTDWIEVTDHDDESRKYQLKRHPIFISDNTLILLTMFQANNHIADMWLHDFEEQIGDHASIAFWQELRASIADEIDRQSKLRNHQFSKDPTR